ncbi:hypothetical protein LG299_12170 [Microbacterium lacus]|uniref:hypothetical protein n=1 Tax=Microbacterium lacus TaxID=415217 RepID=UPI00384F1854
MKLHAYVLAGDPAWIEHSIGAYYDHVERIVVSFDRSKRSWSGDPLSVDESLARIARADPDLKVRLLPGDHVQTGRSVIATETMQRQAALDAASDGADWVVQLDTDEIVPSFPTILRHLDAARGRAASALEYPARMIYARTKSGAFLEHCGRFWTSQSGYPGPVVVAAGTTLTVARQAGSSPLHRVDLSAWNTDPAQRHGVHVHATVPLSEAIIHMSWVRSEQQMAEKSLTSGYASTRDWGADLEMWRRRAKHPLRTAAIAPFAGDPFSRFRIARLPEFAEAIP